MSLDVIWSYALNLINCIWWLVIEVSMITNYDNLNCARNVVNSRLSDSWRYVVAITSSTSMMMLAICTDANWRRYLVASWQVFSICSDLFNLPWHRPSLSSYCVKTWFGFMLPFWTFLSATSVRLLPRKFPQGFLFWATSTLYPYFLNHFLAQKPRYWSTS